MEKRRVAEILAGRQTLEGAGVKLKRAFGSPQMAPFFDPFLLLDDFGSRFPHEYLAGFPWHPHRGIETVTYLLKGEVHHEDSTGTSGILRNGDLQWMDAGSGIFHAEMPKPAKKPDGSEDPEMRGFQLWVNIPAEHKMDDPGYKTLQRDSVPVVELDGGAIVRLVAGELKKVPSVGNITGPIRDTRVDANYLDIQLPPETEMNYTVREGYTAFAYVTEGSAEFGDERKMAGDHSVVLFHRDGDTVRVRSGDSETRLLLISGRPLHEPVAWYGPVVMNTKDQLIKAFQELETGEFVKRKATNYTYVS
ncbi:MAG: pirin family protein [Methanomassiliicoccales archaeon]